jgi:hypothetical protein
MKQRRTIQKKLDLFHERVKEREAEKVRNANAER